MTSLAAAGPAYTANCCVVICSMQMHQCWSNLAASQATPTGPGWRNDWLRLVTLMMVLAILARQHTNNCCNSLRPRSVTYLPAHGPPVHSTHQQNGRTKRQQRCEACSMILCCCWQFNINTASCTLCSIQWLQQDSPKKPDTCTRLYIFGWCHHPALAARTCGG